MSTKFKGKRCKVRGCLGDPGAAGTARGYCLFHYTRWQRYGDPTKGGPRIKKRTARDIVYIQMRHWDREGKRNAHVKGSTIIVEGWTPGQIHKLICDALQAAYTRAREAMPYADEEEERGTPGGAEEPSAGPDPDGGADPGDSGPAADGS